MYKCGWQGCEKAYGTLNHLNAHVTMQSHGTKRTPEGRLESSLDFFLFIANKLPESGHVVVQGSYLHDSATYGSPTS